MRAGAKRWPAKWEALADAFIGRKVSKTGRLAKHYKCAHCQGEFTSTNIEVDHINPVVDPKIGFVDWNTYITRLFCEKSNYQALCKTCHKIKSAQEKKERKKNESIERN